MRWCSLGFGVRKAGRGWGCAELESLLKMKGRLEKKSKKALATDCT
jgi:hypothetical protein